MDKEKELYLKIRMNRELHEETKKTAKKRGMTLNGFVNVAVQNLLNIIEKKSNANMDVSQ